MKKLRLNEKIGFPLLVAMLLMMWLNIFQPSVVKLLILAAFGLTAQVFLSYWGLTTFNDKYEK